jgi:hypothetical protein
MSATSTFTAGLSAVAAAASVNTLDKVRRSVDAHAEAGRLNADAVAALEAACTVRALELADQERVEPAPVVMTLAASAPAPTTGIPTGFQEGEFPAVVATAVERDYDDSGTVLLLTLTADVGGEPVGVRCRFDGNREAARTAAFRSCGQPTGSDPAQLIGRSCRVLLAAWSSSDGRSRVVVKRWIPAPKSAAPTASRPAASTLKFKAPPKSARPAWESDSDIPF